jgi:hypothetical protein
LVAAVAFGAIMAAASLASGQQVNQTQNGVSNSRGCVAPTYFACMARCAPPGSTPEQQARCDRDCADREDPMDCQFARRPLNVAPNISNQGVTLRRP